MLGEIIGELVASIFDEAVLGALFSIRFKPEPPPEEGVWNASIGTVAAFLAALAATFGGLSTLGIVAGRQHDGLVWVILLFAVLMAVFAGVLAHRTFQVTRRRHALAHIGLWLSRATGMLAVVAVAVTVSRITSQLR